jgi:DNA-binding NarL/FixJ family response regulator
VAEGASNKVIARKLDISDATIKAHLTSVYSKLGVAGRLQLGLLLSGKVGRLP